MICNCCGNTEFVAQGSRAAVRCSQCHSVERTRAMRLVLETLDLPKPGSRVLHFAPEYALHSWLRSRAGDGYDPVDLVPERYKYASPRKMDLVHDVERLETGSYDLIIHSHIMEHIPCNVTAVLLHLHRALKPDGNQVCCIPFSQGRRFEESLEPLSKDEATSRFGQHDHVRRFGALDAARTVGMIFDLPEYDLSKFIPREILLEHNVPEYTWRGLSIHSILVLPKQAAKF